MPHRKEKGRALIDGRFCPHAPAVPRNDAMHQRQTDACPFVLLGAVQALEYAKEFGRPLIRNRPPSNRQIGFGR